MTITKDFKKINSLADTKSIYGYYNIYNSTYPRFFQSLLYMINSGDYYYGIVNDCLCILKKKMIGQPVVYLTFPPIHKNGDIDIELETVLLFEKEKIKTRFMNGSIPLGKTKIVKGLSEFIYPITETSLLEGGDWAQFRRYINKFKNCSIKHLTSNIDYAIINKCKELNKQWEVYKKESCGVNKSRAFKTVDTISVFYLMNLSNFLFTGLFDDKDNLICYDLSEKINDNNIVLVTRYFNYNHPQVDNSAYILHHSACKYWYDNGVKGFANFGSSVGYKPLHDSKVRLKPTTILDLYEQANIGKITLDEYKNICKVEDMI